MLGMHTVSRWAANLSQNGKSSGTERFCKPCHWREGQAVVQMARGRYDGVEYAIKFFVSRAAFEAERGLYSLRTSDKATCLAQLCGWLDNVATAR